MPLPQRMAAGHTPFSPQRMAAAFSPQRMAARHIPFRRSAWLPGTHAFAAAYGCRAYTPSPQRMAAGHTPLLPQRMADRHTPFHRSVWLPRTPLFATTYGCRCIFAVAYGCQAYTLFATAYGCRAFIAADGCHADTPVSSTTLPPAVGKTRNAHLHNEVWWARPTRTQSGRVS